MTDRAAWLDLWAEYGFADEKSAGGAGAYRAQLELAVDVADDRLDIDAAVRRGHLREETTTDKHGVEARTRYRLGGVAE